MCLKAFCTFLSFLFLAILIYSFGLYYQYGDDLIFLNILKDMNVGEAIVYKYMYWDGRHLSPAGILQMIGFKFLGPFFSLVLGLGCLGVAVWLWLRMLGFRPAVLESLLIWVLFLIGLFPFYKDVLFWQTGVIYLYFFLQMTLVLALYKGVLGPMGIFKYFLVFLLSLNSQNFNLAVLGYLFVFEVAQSEFFNKKRFGLFCGIIVLATTLISIAPGNFVRIEQGTESSIALENLTTMFFVYLKALNYTKYFFFLGLVGGLYVGFSQSHESKKDLWASIVAGFVSLAPFVLYPDLARIRVFFSLGIFLFFSGLLIGVWLKAAFKLPSFGLLPLTSVFIGLWILVNQVILLKGHSDKILQRHSFLVSQKGASYASHPEIPRNYDLFIIRSPDYTKEWDKDFLEFYEIGEFNSFDGSISK